MKKRICIICLLIVSLVVGSITGVNTSVSYAATSSKPNLYLRVDTIDRKNGNNLAVDVLSGQAGTIYGRVVDKGTACTMKEVLETECSAEVKAGKETAVYLKYDKYEGSILSNHKIGDLCDIYMVFVDQKGNKFGPYVFKNQKLSYFPSGDGSQKNPYQIWTPRNLYNMGLYMEEGTHYKVMQHIDMEGSGYTGRIGGYAEFFNGTLNGNHCIINHLDGQLFYEVGEKGLIYDLNLANIKVEENGTGNIHAAIADTNQGTIKDCYIHGGSVVSGAGGIVSVNKGTIKRCTVQEVKIDGKSSDFVGGIAGRNYGLIQECYTCPIILGKLAIGGIVGQNWGEVLACSVDGGSLLQSSRNIGGIAGESVGDGILNGCISEWKPFDKNDENQGSIVSGECNSIGGLLCFGDVMLPMTDTTDKDGKPLTQEQIVEKQESFYKRHGTYNAENPYIEPAYYAVTWNYNHTFYRPLRIATIVWVLSCFETVEYNKKYPFTYFGSDSDHASGDTNAISVKKATISKVTSKKAKQITVTIKKIEAVEGYEIMYSTDKKIVKEAKKITSKQTTSTIKDLVGNKTYYVKVRAYKLDAKGKKVFGTYSTVESVTTKK